jgi:hypothetical protein
MYAHQNLYTDATVASVIHYNQTAETTQMSTNQGKDE